MKQYFNFSWCLLLLLVGISFSGLAQNIKVQAKLDQTTIALGDQTRLHLIVQLPAKTHIDFPVLADTISSKVQVVEMGRTDTIADKNNPGMDIISRTYTITSFDAGLHMIPAYVFHSKNGDFNTEALPLEVKAVKVDTTKAIYDIKEPLAVSYSFMDWLRDNWKWVVFSLIVVLAVAGLLYYWIKKRKNKPAHVQEARPLVPLHTIALDKLGALRAKKLWEQGQVKAYYSELSDIVREYLEKRYPINALEQTSEEIFSGLRHLNIAEQDMDRLKQLLVLADLVKFAKEKPLPAANEQSMENAISFVMNTKEIPSLTENKFNGHV
ncbi:hypothetical protein HDC92_000457 [Pedobacter sp. AK017]|uniref:hypothetical protein n=1 Tax=Pedobacter sp. AK017 TaxID=2723073 RepID=UPI00160EB68D|nr:hypothetical protein [Pedobacter sp. AK017]MBB5436793.1 hypothetical protein [Pedobacter sp. AK017]